MNEEYRWFSSFQAAYSRLAEIEELETFLELEIIMHGADCTLGEARQRLKKEYVNTKQNMLIYFRGKGEREMKGAKFEIGDKALMMYDDKPVKAIVIQRLFTRRESFGRYSGRIDVDEYTEYVVCLHSGLEKRVHENKLFRTKEELFESFGL